MRTIRYTVIVLSLAVAILATILWFVPPVEMRQVHLDCSRLALGAVSDPNRVTLIIIFAPSAQADEGWQRAMDDARLGSPHLWGSRASRPSAIGFSHSQHTPVRRGAYAVHQWSMWFPLLFVAIGSFFLTAGSAVLEWRARHHPSRVTIPSASIS